MVFKKIFWLKIFLSMISDNPEVFLKEIKTWVEIETEI